MFKLIGILAVILVATNAVSVFKTLEQMEWDMWKKKFSKSMTENTVGLNMCVTLKKCLHKPNIFLIPLNISELTTSQNFFGTVWSTGGVIIAFAENWNFELKFFLVNSFR